MKKLNRHFAGKNVSTDVLSFPASEREGQEDSYLGDILVSAETAQRQARGSLGDELKMLSLHGLLHLLGYDHEVDDGEMFRKEAELRRRFDLVC